MQSWVINITAGISIRMKLLSHSVSVYDKSREKCEKDDVVSYPVFVFNVLTKNQNMKVTDAQLR